ncbi:MAG: DUF4190 domain-containing protein [Clostridiales bacterium]|nr:DUF4190 domain-containing protein [Clostridiales bacterium]
MKYCAHCGAEIYDEAAICTKCGCAVDGIRSPYVNSPSNNYNTLAIVGFVLSFFSAVIGLVLSIIAYKQVKNSGERGRELAIAGIIIGAIETAIIVLYVVIIVGIYLTVLFSVVA